MKGLLLAILLTASVLAGCASTGTDTSTSPTGSHPQSLLAGPALWNDPQNTPHPKWGWATLSNPPAGSVPKWWNPIQMTGLPPHIAGLTHVAQVGGNVTAGAGIALFGSIAVVPDDSQYATFVDISNPEHPVPLGQIDSGGRGAAVVAFPDGRLVAASATTRGFDVIEFTDPVHPVMLNQTTVPVHGGHKLGIVPGTPILYNAGSRGGTKTPLYGPDACQVDIQQCVGYTEIYNLTDPAHPALVQNFQNGLSCHHIFFWNNVSANKYRAICAGLQYTQLWDTADPEHPQVIVSIPVHEGTPGAPSAMLSVADFSHSAGMNLKGNVLYVGDESGGGGAPPGCVAMVNTPAGAISVPVGATWFYDVSNERSPRALGYFSPGIGPDTYVSPAEGPQGIHSSSCTTHHGRLVPDKEGRDLLAMSYYGNGVILLDFTGIDAAKGVVPKVVDSFAQQSNTWETWYYGGYLFTGDLSRGMDVLTFR